MLLTSDSQTLYQTVKDRWAKLYQWVADHSPVVVRTDQERAVARAKPAIDSLHKHWSQEVDKGVTTDSQELCGAYHDLETAEDYAIEHGYPKPAGHGVQQTESCGVTVTSDGKVAQSYEDEIQKHPVLAAATNPKDMSFYQRGSDVGAAVKHEVTGGKSWCQLAGFPAWACDKDGLSDWIPWALAGLGAAFVGTGVYVTYRAATSEVGHVAAGLALAHYSPEASRAYEAVRSARRAVSGDAPAHVLKAVDDEAVTRRYHPTLRST